MEVSSTFIINEIAPRGSMLHYSLLFTEKDIRNYIIAIHGFYDALLKIPRVCHDGRVANRKLDFWHEEISLLFAGQPRHPITKILLPITSSGGIATAMFHEQIEEIRHIIISPRIANFDDFIIHCHHTAGLREMLILKILFPDCTPDSMQWARDIGVFNRMVEIIQYFKLDLENNIIYIPEDLRKTIFTDERNIIKQQYVLQQQKMFLQFKDHVLHFLTNSKKLTTEDLNKTSALGFLRIYNDLQEKLLITIEQDSYQVLTKHYSLNPLRMLWQAVIFHYKYIFV